MNSFVNKSKSLFETSKTQLHKFAKYLFYLIITDSFRGFTYLSPQAKSGFKEDEETKEMVNRFNDEYLEKGWGLLLTCIRCLVLIFVTLSTIFKSNSDYSKVIFYQWPIIFSKTDT